MAARFGFGEAFNFGLPGENRGLIPTPAWKRKTFGQAWHAGETLITSIGQGFILCTPLQLAVMTSRLVNGGRPVLPRLMKNERAEIQKRKSLQLSPQHLHTVLKLKMQGSLDAVGFQFHGKSGYESNVLIQ